MSKKPGFSRRDLLSLTGLVAGSAAVSPAFAQNDSSQNTDGDYAIQGGIGSGEKTGVLYEAARGPWGMLNYFYFYLEAPAHLIEVFPLRNPRTRWAVPLEKEMEFLSVIDSIEMSPSQRQQLRDPNRVGVADGLYVIFPPENLLVNLNPESRAKLYGYLERFEANQDIKNPVRIRSGSVDEWAAGTGMRPDLVEQMKLMVYKRGDLLVFADFPHLISQAKSDAEARVLQKHSSRVRTMAVRLDVKNGPPVAEIMPYWTTGLGLRRKEVEPLIQAAMDTPGVSGLDLVHMLPPLPRKILYTYPDMSMAVEGVMPDCHWTALNFFNYNPEAIYLDEFFAASRLMSDFVQVEPPYRFGDALVFVTEEMNAHHSCIYIAADIVYTKNGRSLYAPWTVLHLNDVKSTYPDFNGKPLRIQGFRRKGGANV
ncbi:MAG: hypothetical protein JNJ70_08985 [Verrucomicrobiales bacterium]|nr:hypothetical protein [Verrucomicrobiales bacterium]